MFKRLRDLFRQSPMIDEEKLLEHRLDDYGQLRVTEANGYRFLYFGEQTEQSCSFIGDPAWLEYDYTRAMLLACFWQASPARTVTLGLGGGSLANALLAHFTPHQLTAVELRPAVVEMASRWMGLSTDPRLEVAIGCAEKYVLDNPASCDLLFADLYMEGGISRLQLQRAFFGQCRRALRPGGVMVVNQWQMGASGQPYAASMLEELFGKGYLQVPVEEGNILLFIPAEGTLPLDRAAMLAWADDLESRLGYSLRPYVQGLRRAEDAPPLV
jgi:spermidine synthase